MNLCYNCMNKIDESGKCQKCGYVHSDNTPPHRLKPGTKLLNGRYLVGNALGEGGFGITYIGFDTRLEMRVAIKEFFPSGFVTRYVKDSATVEASNDKNSAFFKKGKDKFLYEARTIARFSQESGIVDVRDYFEENDTAYIIMEYIEGKNLKVYMREHGIFNIQALLTLFRPIFDALEKIHNVGLIHRDISPDNIMFTKTNTLKLMDFGASANFDDDNISRGAIVLKPGYAPLEQYDRKSSQGPHTDIYALCATIYKCITGVTPDEATVRDKNDELKKPSELGISIPTEIEDAIIKGLALTSTERFNNISELKSIFYGESISFDNISSGNQELYIDDNFETTVIDDNYAEVETTVLDEEQETGLLEKTDYETSLMYDEPETSILEDDYNETALLEEETAPLNEETNTQNTLFEQQNKKSDTDDEPEDNKKSINKKLIFGISGGVLLVILGVILIVFAVNASKSNSDNSLDSNSNGYYIESAEDEDNDSGSDENDYYSDDEDDIDINNDNDYNNSNDEDIDVGFDNDYITLKTKDDWFRYVGWDKIGEIYNFENFEVVLEPDDGRYYLEIDGCLTFVNSDVSEYENKRVRGTFKVVSVPCEDDDISSEIAYDIIDIEEY